MMFQTQWILGPSPARPGCSHKRGPNLYTYTLHNSDSHHQCRYQNYSGESLSRRTPTTSLTLCAVSGPRRSLIFVLPFSALRLTLSVTSSFLYCFRTTVPSLLPFVLVVPLHFRSSKNNKRTKHKQ